MLGIDGLPLKGISVVEFCQVAAGPFCGMLLADMGADVLKIEPPQGDSMRQWPPLTDGFSENFASVNRNKRSVVLDLKSPECLRQARHLALAADVVIENNRPGVMKRLGLGQEELLREKPALVYCSISAFGQTGPRASQGGFDLTVQALSGIMSVTGEEGGAPVKCGIPVSDFCSGLYAAFSVVSMLRRAEETGRGGFLDISMQAASIAVSALQSSQYFGTGVSPVRLGAAHPRNAPYTAYPAADGYFVVAAGNDKLWRAFCDAVGREDLINEPRFRTTSDRAENQIALGEVLRPTFAGFDVDTILDRLNEAGVPCGRINTFEEALEDPQIVHQGLVVPMNLPNGSITRTFGSPVRIDGMVTPIQRRVPALGEHTAEVLSNIPPRRSIEEKVG